MDKISQKQHSLLSKTEELLLQETEELGFVCRSMVAASMPHSKVPGTYYTRSNFDFTVTIMSGSKSMGIPYGAYPRLILAWISSEVVKKRNREILLGNSLADFMKSLGLLVTGGRWGTVTRFKNQLQRVFSSTVSFSYQNKQAGEWVNKNMSIADKSYICWDPNNSDNISLFDSAVTLSELFYNEIISSPIPVDIRAINALKDSSLALDIYFWLTYRMSYLKRKTSIPFDKLQMQFGPGYKYTAHGRYEFKRKFLVQLKKVMTIYPKAKVTLKDDCLELAPSPTHISLLGG